MIYLDNAATSFHRPPEVGEAVLWAMGHLGNDSRGTHGAALESGRVIYETRELLAELFGAAGPEQVAFTSNATEALNTAIKGILKPGDRAVTTVLEHNSVLRPLYEMEKMGVELAVVGTEADTDAGIEATPAETDTKTGGRQTADGSESGRNIRGRLDYAALEREITPGTRAVIVTHASNLTGNLTDIRRIGGMCRRAGALFIVDASQTAGIFPIDMERDCIDVLCFTGHKSLMGPQGTGGICVRKGLEIRPLKSGGSGILTFSKTHPSVMPAALEAGTLNGHGIAGLGAAVRWLKEQGADRLRAREQKLAGRFYGLVREIPDVRIYGDFSAPERAAIVSLNLDGEDSARVSDWLAWEHGIYTRAGGHCAPLMHGALGTREQGAVRFSFSHFNTDEEVETAAAALRSYIE